MLHAPFLQKSKVTQAHLCVNSVPVSRQEGRELGHCEVNGAVLDAKGLDTGPKWVGLVSSVLVLQVARLAKATAPDYPTGIEG